MYSKILQYKLLKSWASYNKVKHTLFISLKIYIAEHMLHFLASLKFKNIE